MLREGALLRYAHHANRCAQLLARQLEGIDGVQVMHPCQANAVFVRMPHGLTEALKARGWYFYTFIGSEQARFMCSWSTREEDVLALAAEVRALAGGMSGAE